MVELSPDLSLNLSQILGKTVQVNDLKYDYYTKYVAVACKSQGLNEVVILVKDSTVPGACNLTYVTNIVMKAEPLFLSWAPPNFGKILIVVLSDNTLVYYKSQNTNKGESWLSFYDNNNIIKAISCMDVGTSSNGEFLVALGSLNGHISVVFSQTNYDVHDFQAHVGGVNLISFNGNLLASSGIDGFINIWQLDNNNKFELLQKIPIEHDGNSLIHFHSIQWSKDNELILANDSFITIYSKDNNNLWTHKQTHNSKSISAFTISNNRIIVTENNSNIVYTKNSKGLYQPA